MPSPRRRRLKKALRAGLLKAASAVEEVSPLVEEPVVEEVKEEAPKKSAPKKAAPKKAAKSSKKDK